MKRYVGFFLLLLVIGGCESNSAESNGSSQSIVEAPTVGAVSDLARTAVGLYLEQGVVRVGDSWADAEAAMPEPKGASEFSDLPARFQKPYQGRGWESSDAGFGVILYEDQIAAAMMQNERASLEDYATLTKWYEQELPKAKTDTVVSGDLRYRFWEQDGQRVMVLAENRPGGAVYLSAAMGDHRVMDALGMTPEAATHDGKVVLRLLNERKLAAETRKTTK
jgi:hypothetical protein